MRVCVCVCVCVCMCARTNSRELEHPCEQSPPIQWPQQQSHILPHAAVLFIFASGGPVFCRHREDNSF
jgi:hypothetical protein